MNGSIVYVKAASCLKTFSANRAWEWPLSFMHPFVVSCQVSFLSKAFEANVAFEGPLSFMN